MEYILSAIFVFLLAVLLITFTTTKHSGEGVKIIINADSSNEDTEMLIIAAMETAEKYLPGAKIYIEGESELYVNILCRKYNAEKL